MTHDQIVQYETKVMECFTADISTLEIVVTMLYIASFQLMEMGKTEETDGVNDDATHVKMLAEHAMATGPTRLGRFLGYIATELNAHDPRDV